MAQTSGRIPTIGWLTAQRPASLAPYIEAMQAGLAELGYVDGQSIRIEFRYANDDTSLVPKLARELIDLPVDLIVVQGGAVYIAAKLDLPVPLVYCISADPILSGLADSLAHPRGNMTGLTFMLFEFAAKRIELLREMVPDIERVAVLGNPLHMGADREMAHSDEAARGAGVRAEFFPTSSRVDLERVLGQLPKFQPQAISLLADGFATQYRADVLDFAKTQNIPVCSGWSIFAQSGALFTYGPRLTESYRRLAYYTTRVLRGARPSELPIERPTKFEFVINMATARDLAIKVPRATLARADEVIG